MSAMTTTEAAAQIVANVRRRGYWPADWPAWVVALRQGVKLQEELCEMLMPAREAFGSDFAWALREMEPLAREEFRDVVGWEQTRDMAMDMPESYITPEEINWRQMRAEAVDMLIVLRFLFAAIEAHTGEKFDADSAAVVKSAADITRGTK